MNIIICIDDNNGMMFNHRRQSQDKYLREHLLNMIGTSPLWMNAYSKKQFEEDFYICVSENFLEAASEGEYCFVEDQDIIPYLEKIEKIILFRWNRSYPADVYFDASLLSCGWILTEVEEFAGSSHEKITKEVYTR